MRYSDETLSFLASLPISGLSRVLSRLSKAEASGILLELSRRTRIEAASESSEDMERKRRQRSKAAEIFIPEVKDPQRRERCLADPERFLKTYAPARFRLPFAEHHRAMIEAINERARSGGDKAIAAPRGEGKTQIATWMVVYILLARLRDFPLVLAANGRLAGRVFRQIRDAFTDYPDLVADFPEVCVPAIELAGAPQRAAKQHVAGERTRIVWTSAEIGLPYVPGSQYGGQYVTSLGMDSAFRGFHINGTRPDFVLIDDPETREVAFSDDQHHNVEQLIDGDVALLAGPDQRISRVILTTVQNRKCYSYRVTSKKLKPSWDGERYQAVTAWPTRMDLWDEYIARRQQAQQAGDKDGMDAVRWYAERREEMQAGAVVANPYRFAKDTTLSGEAIELDALQAIFNKVADLGMPRVMAELQNDPEDEIGEVETEITPGAVQSALSRLGRSEKPDGSRIFVGIDVGKYSCHWVKIAAHGNASANIIDYGVARTHDSVVAMSNPQAIEREILRALLEWRDEITADDPPELCFVDSGAYTAAVYEFVRLAGGIPFVAAKGHTSRQMRFEGIETKPTSIVYDHCRADFQGAESGVWLYNFDSVYWKRRVHEGFRIGAYDAGGDWADGGLSLWSSGSVMTHKSFSHHICAEMWEEKFIEGKGVVGKWEPKSRANHWLDATAMALAASGVAGFRVLPQTARRSSSPSTVRTTPGRMTTPDGRPWLVTERKGR